MHAETSEYANTEVKVQFKGGRPQIEGSKEEPVMIFVEEWWDKLTGKSWGFSDGNPAAMIYGMRAGLTGLPWDDEVLYGKGPNGLGYLFHISEIVKS